MILVLLATQRLLGFRTRSSGFAVYMFWDPDLFEIPNFSLVSCFYIYLRQWYVLYGLAKPLYILQLLFTNRFHVHPQLSCVLFQYWF